MAKKKASESEVSPPPTPQSQSGFSREAWVAIGTLGAALITGVVTLIIHLYPQTPLHGPGVVNSPAPPSPTSAPTQRPNSADNADAIAGKWLGQATDAGGKSFLVTLQIRKACALNEQCGSISVPHVPCYGEVFLEKIDNGDFEFRVANFYGDSNRKLCQPGAGEHFKLRSDGKLLYTTTYEPEAEGLLERQDE